MIDSSLKRIDTALDTRAGQVIYGVYTLNAIFSLLYLSAGMVMVSVMKISKMRKQISVLRALGISDRAIKFPLLIDATSGILISLAIGGILGLLLTNFLIQFPLVYFGINSTSDWSRLPINLSFPVVTLVWLIGTSFLFTLVANYVIVSRALKSNIADDIKYNE